MNAIYSVILGGFFTCMPLLAQQNGTPAATATQEEQANIQLAILLDTSGSMNGLLNQARTHIWKIVNELTLARQNGKLPKIEIALYEYGMGNPTESKDYMRQVLPLTDDLDAISEALFALKTSGSEEYCGTVIKRAVNELKWNTSDKNALKMIFIAGNEEFDQGDVDPGTAIKEALAKGITVNTIYCGQSGDRVAPGWSAGSKQGDGSFVSINQNTINIDPDTPYDQELAKLGKDINKTYLAYGNKNIQTSKVARQVAQDEMALAAAPAVMAERVSIKAKSDTVYDNSSWDLVDAKNSKGAVDLNKLKAENQLPKELEGKTEEEMKQIIAAKAKEREEIQKQIRDLTEKRQKWLNDNRKKEADDSTLDKAIIESIHKQAAGKQFSFEKK